MSKIVGLLIVLLMFNAVNAQKNIDIIRGFYQGLVVVSDDFQKCSKDNNLGNCATIALIKCALIEFETKENIFKSYKKENDVISCVFNDDVEVSINFSDIEIVKKLSGIKYDNSSSQYEDAIIVYALICKRVLNNNNGTVCIKDFTNAVEYINSGYSTDGVHNLLGLKKKYVRIRDLVSYKSAIIWTGAHASYCTYGIQDILGNQHKVRFGTMKNPKGIGGVIRKGYVLLK